MKMQIVDIFYTDVIADITSIAAADIVHDFLGMMVSSEPPKPRDQRTQKKSEVEL